MDIREMFKKGEYLLFDGGMGTMLQAAGIEPGVMPEEWNIVHPDRIEAVHRAYVEAGSDVVTTNTFGANSRKYNGPVADTIRAAVAAARRSGARYVAQDIGPMGLMLKPLGESSFEEAYELFKEQVAACQGNAEADGNAADRPDMFIIETMTDLLEIKAAVLAVKENSDLPVIATMSYEKTGRTFLGVSAAAATVTLCGLGVDAVGVNCSLGPDELGDIVEEICRYSTVPVIVQANAGIPASVDGKTVFNVAPGEYCEAVKGIIANCREKKLDKIRILGGCCGTNPEYIRGLKNIIAECGANNAESGLNCDGIPQGRFGDESFDDLTAHALVCSSSLIVDYDNRTAVVGERLNPTGKKKISAALREGNYDLLVAEALQEYECGAQILDVNAGLPDIDESAVLVTLITELQGACPLPLQIDTTDAGALEQAVRHYSGKPVINSVNGKEESLNAVLPIAAKYGAAVICLTLDENGIPSKAEDRLAIAERIMKRAGEYGIPSRDLIIDGLVMTVSTNQAEARETLKTVGLARTRLGLHTCLGVSNISFGLPNREVLNAAFLAEAFTCGLNLPIIDPTKERYMQTVYSHRVLSGEDENSVNYIQYSVEHPVSQGTAANAAPGTGGSSKLIAALGGDNSPAGTAKSGQTADGKNVAQIVLSGNKLAIGRKTRELLTVMSPLNLINNEFIPALDLVGVEYEQGRIFLPQLMSAAETAKKGFDIIKEAQKQTKNGQNAEGFSRMPVVLATVKGDIHDIGKNIVRMLLENYGYEVIDLGKDVAADVIVETVKARNIKLVGLSALMTTTVHSMEETIKALRKECPECKIIVGGAVLTAELATRIGADYYAKDAAETARIAGELS